MTEPGATGAASEPASHEDWTWEQHQEWEAAWWAGCVNTFGEEAKQITYAHRMGLVNTPRDGQWPVYDLGGRSVLDIGGGPASILLKCVNRGTARVLDPCDYPAWIRQRYETAGIDQIRMRGEDLYTNENGWDEIWIYNVLQHTDEPELIAANAVQAAKVVRVFDWIDTPPEPGHPHTLTVPLLNEWFHTHGTTELFSGENGLYGAAWYAVIEDA